MVCCREAIKRLRAAVGDEGVPSALLGNMAGPDVVPAESDPTAPQGNGQSYVYFFSAACVLPQIAFGDNFCCGHRWMSRHIRAWQLSLDAQTMSAYLPCLRAALRIA